MNLPSEVVMDAICVDAACSGNPGPMEYRGVDLLSGQQIFHFGPIQGTNNIGEFLAIVHALALMDKQGINRPVYSDSKTALAWYRNKKSKTALALNDNTAKALELVKRAEYWLNTHDISRFRVMKWETEKWGEVPADFGRK